MHEVGSSSVSRPGALPWGPSLGAVSQALLGRPPRTPRCCRARCDPAWCRPRGQRDRFGFLPLVPREYAACIRRAPLFVRAYSPRWEQPEGRDLFSLKTTALGAAHAAPPQRPAHLCEAELGGDGGHRPGRGLPQAGSGCPLARGRAGGAVRYAGLGGGGLREAARPRHRPPSTKDDRELPRCGTALPAPRASRDSRPGPGSPAQDSPGRDGTRRDGTAPHSPAPHSPAQPSAPLLQAARPLRVLLPLRCLCRCRCRAVAPGSSRGTHRSGLRRPCAPRRPAPPPPRPRGCSGSPGMPRSGVHLPGPARRPRLSLAPLASLGLIVHRSAAPTWGRLPPGQPVLCTALSPFSAISNLHALSFLRYRLILVWRSRFAILSHAHSCG